MSRVLVVEDDEVVRDVVASHLRRAAHDVVEAGTAGEAFVLLAGQPPPDVAVLDVGLPDMDGFELQRVLAEDYRSQPPLIVFLSGRVEDHDVDAGRRTGCIYLTKPFIAATLLDLIDRYNEAGVS